MEDEHGFVHDSDDEIHVDRQIAALAARQHTIVARRQLAARGLGRGAIDLRVGNGRLHPRHRGVYSTGQGPLTRSGHWMAALFAVGEDAALSHRAAATFRGVMSSELIEITAPRRCVRPGIRTYQGTLTMDEVEVVDGIRLTTLHRTLIDLAAVLSEQRLESVMAKVARDGLTDRVPLQILLERHPRRPGVPKIRRVLARGRLAQAMTRSELEDAFRAYARRHRLPEPECNAHVPDRDGILMEVDAVYRAARLAIELDSREWHDNPVSFATDRHKSRRLSVAGWQPIRVAPEHLHDAALARDLRRMLAGVP